MKFGPHEYFLLYGIKQLQHPLLHSILFIRLQSKKAVSSTVTSEMQAAWNLISTTVSIVIVARLPC